MGDPGDYWYHQRVLAEQYSRRTEMPENKEIDSMTAFEALRRYHRVAVKMRRKIRREGLNTLTMSDKDCRDYIKSISSALEPFSTDDLLSMVADFLGIALEREEFEMTKKCIYLMRELHNTAVKARIVKEVLGDMLGEDEVKNVFIVKAD